MARVLHLGFPIIRNVFKPNLLILKEVKISCRQYARNILVRTPITPRKDKNDDPEWRHKKAPTAREIRETEDPDDYNNNNIPQYEKLSDRSNVFPRLIASAKSKKMREKTGKVMLEGKRLIKDALEAGVELEHIFFSKDEALLGLELSKIPNLKLCKLAYHHISLWSNLATSPGLVGIFDLGKLRIKSRPALPLTVICDNVREPGNLGSVLRCAVAVGCKQILLTKGCADIWDPKVLRSGCGAHFRARVESDVGWESVCNHVSDDAAVYLASNECAAASAESDEIDTLYFRTPHTYEVREDGKKVQIAYQTIREDDDKKEGEDEEEEVSPRFPTGTTSVYHDVRFGDDKEIVVIVGGETEGLSNAARKFTLDRCGQSIFIPLENNVESLNSGVALGVILFEIQRQCRVNQKLIRQ